MKRVLITGASGFIGSRLINLFENEKYEVFAWNRMEIVKDGEIILKAGMSSVKNIKYVIEEIMPNIIVHCAGSADVGKSVQHPEEDYEGNVTVTHNLLFAIHEIGIKNVKVVFLSSASVYGNPISLPISEDMPLNPLSPYAVHKVMCEELCKYFINNYGMDIKIARIFSAYGEGLKKQIFWDMYQKYLQVGKLAMFGTGYESRDYIHVSDVVNALYLIATANTKDVVFNIANGEEIFINQVTDCFAECVCLDKKKIEFNGIVREGDPLNWKADITRIKMLGYQKHVKLDEGISNYILWAKEASVLTALYPAK